ncbi:DUF1672 domain-containing protein [Staphylococcus xylosus]|nr:DUF1672 family protein [Staphylococcus xylosus]MCM3518711.1 DUF1672 domain-containing protein [Staphylococcus xylosus]MCQ3817441.1 DUF1672 family protein [Staphylococcus xylosus]MCQ3820144.1 DUF1672 family protein [Staphylococcus xylosus]UBV37533.1 DUF1672 family protein [Staphylococcus xylosus]
MAANEYKGLGFQPPTEQSVIDYAKKHRKSFEKKGESFKEGMKHARKELSYEADANVVTTLFSTKDNYSKENNEDNVFEIADKLESSKVMPSNIDLDLRFTDNNIGTVKPRYDDKDVTSFGVFKNE